jgi:hypothetical protein
VLPSVDLDLLRDAVDASCLVKVAHAVEQRQFDASHRGEASVALHLVDQRRLIDLTECVRTLIKELQAMATHIEVAQLPRTTTWKTMLAWCEAP